MPSNRLLNKKDFQAVKKGESLVGKCLVLEVIPAKANESRLGLAVSKRYGKACKRNRFKRLVRESFRSLLPELKQNIDIVVRPRKFAVGVKCQEIAKEMRILLDKAF